MKIPKEYDAFFHHLKAGERDTLKDDQTKLFIIVDNEMYRVTVDRGIIPNVREGIKKCDFLCYDEINMKCHLIELKGTVIKRAYEQIEETLKNIEGNEMVSFLLKNLQILDAYIVSSGRQEVPRGVDDVKRQLAKKLAKRCSARPKNIDDLLMCVRVVANQKVLSQKDGHILCSNEAPLRF